MTECSFAVANTSYLITAINLIHEDEVLAKACLRLDDETIKILKNLTADEIRLLGAMPAPLMEIKMDQRVLEDLKSAVSSKKPVGVMNINNRMLLKVS